MIGFSHKSILDSPLLEQLEKARIKTIMKSGICESKMKLFCPYCAVEQKKLNKQFNLNPNGKDQKAKCHKCKNVFIYTVNLLFNSRTQE